MVEEECGADKFRCASGDCVNGVWYCDGHQVRLTIHLSPCLSTCLALHPFPIDQNAYSSEDANIFLSRLVHSLFLFHSRTRIVLFVLDR